MKKTLLFIVTLLFAVSAWAQNNTVTFTYNGEEVTYGFVEKHGLHWMDRNLGATQVPTASDDELGYGDLFQWGRLDDGHQVRTSNTTTTLSTSDVPGHDDFITVGNNYPNRLALTT